MPYSCLPDPLPRSAEGLHRFLLHQRPPAVAALGLPAEFVVPCYDLSVANVPATLAALLGGDLVGAAPPLPRALWEDLAPGVRRIVWLILDAVGWHPFSRLLAMDPALGRAWLGSVGRLLPLTSVLPSTTTAALITLWTGYATAQHGLVGHTMLLRQYGLVADMLMLGPRGAPPRDQLIDRGLDPETFLPVPGLAAALAGHGIVTRALINVDLAKTGFSRLCFRGVTEVIRFVTAADMWVRMREALEAHPEERLLLVGYLSEFDGIGHVEGIESEAWRAVMRSLTASLEREFLQALTPHERQGTLLAVAADHGQLAETSAPVSLEGHPALWDELLLPATGSPRAAYLHAAQGRMEAARRYLQERLADEFAVVGSRAALEAGLFGLGRPAPDVSSRLGDLVVLGRANHLLGDGQRDYGAPGMHAGLSAQEMLVPLLLRRLDAEA